MTINYLKDFYKILEIAKEATVKDIKEAHRCLVLKYHPDKNKDKNAASKFLDITEAYETLKDSELRQDYDENHKDPSILMFVDVITKNIPIDKVKEYIDAGAIIDICNSDNKTILMFAVNRGYVELSKFLIENGASVDVVDIYGNDLLIFAAAIQIDFNTNGFNVIKAQPKQQAYHEEEKPTEPEPEPEVKLEKEPENKESPPVSEEPIKINSDEIEKKVDDLLERKAEIVKILLEKNVKVGYKNHHGNDALEHAALNQNIKIIELLKNYAEKPLISPLDEAMLQEISLDTPMFSMNDAIIICPELNKIEPADKVEESYTQKLINQVYEFVFQPVTFWGLYKNQDDSHT